MTFERRGGVAPRSASPLFSIFFSSMSDLDFRKSLERGDTLGVEVVMRKFLSLAVMCSLAFPAMAFAQETGQPEPPKEKADELGTGEAPPEPGKEAIMAGPEAPKVAADDIAEAEPDVGATWKDGLSWMLMTSAFYRISGYAGEGVRAGTYNDILGVYGNQ